jgi:hypothetical protein
MRGVIGGLLIGLAAGRLLAAVFGDMGARIIVAVTIVCLIDILLTDK